MKRLTNSQRCCAQARNSGETDGHLARILPSRLQPGIEELGMIAGNGRLSAEVEAKTVSADPGHLQEDGDPLGAVFGDGKTDLRAIDLARPLVFHPFGMFGDVSGTQAAAEGVAVVTVHPEPTVDDHVVFGGKASAARREHSFRKDSPITWVSGRVSPSYRVEVGSEL